MLENIYGSLLEVLYKIFNYPLHEKKAPNIGVLFKRKNQVFPNSDIKVFKEENKQLAYKLSDSNKSFVLYEEDKFIGLIIFDKKIENEKEFLDLANNNESIFITSTKGINKIYFNDYIFANEGKYWTYKLPLQFYVEEIKQKIPSINKTVTNLLSFAFYVLSPNKIGATIVYVFSDLNNIYFNDFQTFKENENFFNVNNANELNTLKNLLSDTDGAMFIDKDGNFLNYGVHLSYSTKSKQLIKQEISKGTRHSSASRYSFDHPQCLIITVSEDGPVTIFSDGINIINKIFSL